MHAISASIVAVLLAVPAAAQYDLGLAVGGMHTELHVKQSDEDNTYAWVSDVGRWSGSASVFYRERYSEHVDLGLDLTWAHRSFSAGYSHASPGSSEGFAAHAEIDQLYLGIKPEVRLDTGRLAVVRFGIMAGFLVGGRVTGTADATHVGGGGYHYTDTDLKNHFGGDLRFAFGFGFRVPLGGRWAMTIDPEASIAFSSMMRSPDAGLRGTDLGLRIGLSRRSAGRALSKLITPPPRDPAHWPEW